MTFVATKAEEQKSRGYHPKKVLSKKKLMRMERTREGQLYDLAVMFTLNLVSLGYQVNSFQRSPVVVFSLV
jgi:hypothetical protein